MIKEFYLFKSKVNNFAFPPTPQNISDELRLDKLGLPCLYHREGSCLVGKAGGRVLSGPLCRASWFLILQEDFWLQSGSHGSCWKGFKSKVFSESFREMAF